MPRKSPTRKPSSTPRKPVKLGRKALKDKIASLETVVAAQSTGSVGTIDESQVVPRQRDDNAEIDRLVQETARLEKIVLDTRAVEGRLRHALHDIVTAPTYRTADELRSIARHALREN